jgi:hypothetical protein
MAWFRHLFDTKKPDETPPVVTSTAIAAPRPLFDLVDGLNVLAAYFRYLEGLAYENGLRSMRERRDFRDELTTRVEAILAYSRDTAACQEIQYELDKERRAFLGDFADEEDFVTHVQPEESLSPSDRARKMDPKGYKLLALAPPLTFDSLKQAYRIAAKRYHPDVGGDTATMQHLNDAYSLFSSVLNREEAEASADASLGQRFGFQTTDQFFSVVRAKRFSMAIDDLALERALHSARDMNVGELIQAFDGARDLSRLCNLLFAAGKGADGNELLTKLGEVAEAAKARQLNYVPLYEKAVRASAAPTKIRFVPNHKRQADNLHRLGVFDDQKFKAAMGRISGDEGVVAAAATSFLELVSVVKFTVLPMDPIPNVEPIVGLVPGPDYYARVESMSDPQRQEYARAFHGARRDLALKYIVPRMDALLRTPFLDEEMLDDCLDEMRRLEGILDGHKSLRALCSDGIRVLAFLHGQSTASRRKRIKLLLGLDASPDAAVEVVISLENVDRHFAVMPRSISLGVGYAEFATGELIRIERYARTGSEETPEEQERSQATHRELFEFRESSLYRTASDAASAQPKVPEQIADAVGLLCLEL